MSGVPEAVLLEMIQRIERNAHAGVIDKAKACVTLRLVARRSYDCDVVSTAVAAAAACRRIGA